MKEEEKTVPKKSKKKRKHSTDTSSKGACSSVEVDVDEGGKWGCKGKSRQSVAFVYGDGEWGSIDFQTSTPQKGEKPKAKLLNEKFRKEEVGKEEKGASCFSKTELLNEKVRKEEEGKEEKRDSHVSISSNFDEILARKGGKLYEEGQKSQQSANGVLLKIKDESTFDGVNNKEENGENEWEETGNGPLRERSNEKRPVKLQSQVRVVSPYFQTSRVEEIDRIEEEDEKGQHGQVEFENVPSRERVKKNISNKKLQKQKIRVVSPYFQTSKVKEIDRMEADKKGQHEWVEFENVCSRKRVKKNINNRKLQKQKVRVVSPYFPIPKVEEVDKKAEEKVRREEEGKEETRDSNVSISKNIDEILARKGGKLYEQGHKIQQNANGVLLKVKDGVNNKEEKGENEWGETGNGPLRERSNEKRPVKLQSQVRVVSPYFQTSKVEEIDKIDEEDEKGQHGRIEFENVPSRARVKKNLNNKKLQKQKIRVVSPYFQTSKVEEIDRMEADKKGQHEWVEFENVPSRKRVKKNINNRKSQKQKVRVVSPYFPIPRVEEVDKKAEKKVRREEEGKEETRDSHVSISKNIDEILARKGGKLYEQGHKIQQSANGVLLNIKDESTLDGVDNKEDGENEWGETGNGPLQERRNGKWRIKLQAQVMVASPYFQTSEVEQIDRIEEEDEKGQHEQVEFENFPSRKRAKKNINNKKLQKQKVRVVSPYFPIPKVEEVDKKAEEENWGIKLPKSKSRKKMQSEIVVVSPYFHNAHKEDKNCIVLPKKASRKRIVVDKPVFSASQKQDEAYLRRTSDNTWKPPRSQFSLLQEDHAHDPWRVVVICILLNRTSGLQVGRILSDLFTLCPDAKTATEVATEDIEKVIQTLGLHRKRAVMIQRFSQEYLWKDWTHVTQLHGVGKKVGAGEAN